MLASSFTAPTACRSARPFAAGAAPIYLFLAIVWSLMPVALVNAGLHVALDQFGTVGGAFAFMLWFAWCLRGRGLARIATALEACTLFSTICITITLMTFLAAASHRPFFDAPLAYADRVLLPGFDWPAVMLCFSRSGTPVRIANWVYHSICWQPALLIATLAMMSAPHRIWHFLLSWITTLCIVLVVFAGYPVLGAYHHFGIAAADVPAVLNATPWEQPALLEALHNGALGVISLDTLDGIVNFPSFHAGAAVLLGWGFWPVRGLRWPLAALNTLMLCSAVPIGGHYVIDLPAGVIAAIAGIAAATWIAELARNTSDRLKSLVEKRDVIRPLPTATR